MKKIIAILLAVCVVFGMTGCVSQDEFDALTTERDALQVEFNALQSQYDSLNSAVEPYGDLLDAMDAEDYETAMGIVSEKQVAKQLAEKGDIEEHLVTVELTLDNFDEYFQWESRYNVNTFGEEEPWYVQFVLVSTAYEQGLILYQADAKLSYTYAFTAVQENGYTSDESVDSNYEWKDISLPSTGVSGMKGMEFPLEKCGVTMTRVEGTVTFVKADYVTGYEVGEVTNGYIQQGTVTLVNGETLQRSIRFGYKY